MDSISKKAKDLFRKFTPLVDFDKKGLVDTNAKKCAIICCEEILNLNCIWFAENLIDDKVVRQEETIEFWEKVLLKIKIL